MKNFPLDTQRFVLRIFLRGVPLTTTLSHNVSEIMAPGIPIGNFTHAMRSYEIGDFSWSSHRSSQSDIHMTCEPNKADKQTIWSCLANVTFLRVGCYGVLDQTTSVHLFKNNDPTFHFSTHLRGKKGHFYYSRVKIDIVQSSCTDLSDPKNQLIEDPEDSAHFKIGGVEIICPKGCWALIRPSSTSCLLDINPRDFLRFLGVIHSIDLSVDKDSLDGLLYLGDFFQCKLVLRICEDYLLRLTEKKMRLANKLETAYHYKLNYVLLDAKHVVPNK
ncbi:hypothetical protein L596_013012 [Steinernema carpocapsae]|uniref:BTB domain-containing protein n=1 Tax=Steinernema carpocapsae TaxID=34508 RepID=A0A4U5NZD9_STECR|nr:hypothetical protein L596_013012 [Steinernema carpocapsae]